MGEQQPELEPVTRTITVPLGVEDAFDLFTTGMGSWWPTVTHSVSLDERAAPVLEPGVGGHCYEVAPDGSRSEWATVTAWEPPSRLALSWYPGASRDAATDVEVRFSAAGEGTVVRLEHRGWERLGAVASRARESYVEGWPQVLGRYSASAALAPRSARA